MCENLFTKSLPMLEEASLECAGTDACANEKETCLFFRARRKKTKSTKRLSAYGSKCNKSYLFVYCCIMKSFTCLIVSVA